MQFREIWCTLEAQPTFAEDGRINESSYFFSLFGLYNKTKKKSLGGLFHSTAFCTRSLSLYLVLLLRLTHLVADCLRDMRLQYPWEWCKAVLLSCLEECAWKGQLLVPTLTNSGELWGHLTLTFLSQCGKQCNLLGN